MDKNRLSEEKRRFNELYKNGDFAAAREVADGIMRDFPDSPSGWYYGLVLETKNFRVPGDREKAAALYASFAERAEKPTAEKYGRLLEECNRAAEKPAALSEEQTAAPAVRNSRFSLCGLLLGILCVLFAAASVLSWGTFRMFSEPYTCYQATRWDNGAYDSVVYKLTLNEGQDNKKVVVSSVWLNLGGIDHESGAASASIMLTSATGSTSAFTSGFGGGAKSVPNVNSSVGNWIKLADMTSTSTSRVYYMLSTKNELSYNEVVFLDNNGKKIEAEIFCAGPNEKPTDKLGELIKSDIYDYKAEAAAATLDEQDTFSVSAVGANGVYANEYYTGRLTEREILTLDSVRNILSGDSGYTDETVNAFGLQLIAVGVALFGGNSFGLRIVPMLFAIGTIVLMYFFMKRLFSSSAAGLAAAFLFAISGYALSSATLGSVEAIYVFFCLLSVFFMSNFYTGATKQNKRSFVYLALSGAAYALAVSVKTNALFLLLGLAVIFVFALVKQNKAAKRRAEKAGDGAKEIAYGCLRTRNLYVTTFLIAFVLGAAVWVALTFLFSYGVYFGASVSAGSFLKDFFAAPFVAADTGYAANNKTNVLGWLIGYQAEKLSSYKYFFGNTALSVLALFSFIYSTVYVAYSYISHSAESKTSAFAKNVFTPYLVLTAGFLAAWIYAAFGTQTASGFSLGSVFYLGFIVLALRLLSAQEKRTVSVGGVKAGISAAIFAAVVLFALILGVFSYARYAGIALESYPLPFAAIRW